MNSQWWPVTEIPFSFSLLLSPPASGKTRMLWQMLSEGERQIIFLSPLKALAHEFYRESSSRMKNVFWPQRKKDLWENVQRFKRKAPSLLIMTVELMDDAVLEIFATQAKGLPLIFLDEFHLYYDWGLGFRPLMWEKAMAVANSGLPIIGASATMSNQLLENWKNDFSFACDYLFLIDEGNNLLRYHPKRIHYFPPLFTTSFRRRFLDELVSPGQETYLYFCRTRDEVDAWMDFCQRWGILALGCVGGEVDHFMEQLKILSKPRCIFSTIALGHGVNLPPLTKIFLSFPPEHAHGQVQLIGRGGRRGESYEVFMVGGNWPWKVKAISLLKLLMSDVWIRLKHFVLLRD